MATPAPRWDARRPDALAGAVTAAGVAAAGLSGALVAMGAAVGLASIVALTYAPLVLMSLGVALALWVPLMFFEGLPGANNVPEAGVLLLTVGWLAMLRTEPRMRAVLRAHRRVLFIMMLFVAWALVTVAWAPEPAHGLALMPSFLNVALIYVIVLTALAGVRQIRLLALFFVLGVAASVMLGVAGGDGALGGALFVEGRLNGGMSDPNDLALAIVAALGLLGGLLASTRSPLARWTMGGVLAVLLLVALNATGSRGGLVAAGVAVLAALWLHRRSRMRVLAFLCLALAIGGVWFLSNPAALQRFTGDEYGGSGRSDLWQLAWREVQDHPIHGVGLGNFAVAAEPYLREPGVLKSVQHIERNQETHNLYLGLLAETGIIGLLLYLVVPLVAVRAAIRAGHRFEAAGDHAAASLAHGVAVACIGVLAAAFFLPDAADKRLWVLFALGPALLAASTTAGSERTEATLHGRARRPC